LFGVVFLKLLNNYFSFKNYLILLKKLPPTTPQKTTKRPPKDHKKTPKTPTKRPATRQQLPPKDNNKTHTTIQENQNKIIQNRTQVRQNQTKKTHNKSSKAANVRNGPRTPPDIPPSGCDGQTAGVLVGIAHPTARRPRHQQLSAGM
jgi:hypothetical protein